MTHPLDRAPRLLPFGRVFASVCSSALRSHIAVPWQRIADNARPASFLGKLTVSSVDLTWIKGATAGKD